MAIGIQMEFSGATLTQYDEVIKKKWDFVRGTRCTWWPISLGNQN